MNAFDPSLLALETERLRLRPLNDDDEALYQDLYTDPETMRFIAPPLSAEKAASSFRKVVALQREPTLASRFMVIEEKTEQKALGICGTSTYDADALRVEVGIVLKNEGRSRGIGSEALPALMNRIFAVSPVQEICVGFSAQCPAVRRLNVRVGLMPCVDAVREAGAPSKYVWSVRRSSWYVNQSTN